MTASDTTPTAASAAKGEAVAADANPVASASEQTVRVLAEAHKTIRAGAPGLSDQTCNVLAGIIARKVSLIYAQPQPSQQAGAAVGIMSAEDAPVWAEGIVTDGEHAAIAQKAEADYGGTYWSVETGDGAADRADRLYRALVEVRDSVETYPLDDSQTCMCGSPVEGHNVGSGHAPVSQADHAISLIVEAIDKALGIAAIPDHALIGAGRPDDYEGPDVGMHDTEIVESEND